jgi:ubiquinone biosynthesis monooxygenase Coq7
MAFWGNGGFALGALTVALGRQGVWICTAAVEGVVHKHLEDQLFFLRERDPALHALIASIQGEELAHLRHAEDRLEAETWWSRLIGTVISKATDAVIWLSTWGDSSEMARDLAAAKRAA